MHCSPAFKVTLAGYVGKSQWRNGLDSFAWQRRRKETQGRKSREVRGNFLLRTSTASRQTSVLLVFAAE